MLFYHEYVLEGLKLEDDLRGKTHSDLAAVFHSFCFRRVGIIYYTGHSYKNKPSEICSPCSGFLIGPC